MTNTTNEGLVFTPLYEELFYNTRYKGLSAEAKLLYSFYYKRHKLSAHVYSMGNTMYADKNGIFIVFSNEEATELLGYSNRKITNLKNELINFGLIKTKRCGLYHLKIYVQPIQTDDDNNSDNDNSSYKDDSNLDNTKRENSNNTKAEKDNANKQNMRNSKIYNKYIYTRDTKETKQEKIKINKNSSNTFEKQALESLKNKVSPILSLNAFGRISVLAQGQYEKAKWLIDTIFKAKSQIESRLLSSDRWLYSQEGNEAIRFETNNFLSRGVESALLQITEIIYRQHEEIKNIKGFIYVYLRKFMSSAVKKYLTQNFELSEDTIIELNELVNFKKPVQSIG
ncbi:replication initiator protein A [Ligilactobacillus salivarius]|uniref:replication initiator protein A n=1 Tax=Ligilactobacillus salivarius TaxID=1624 RepID=UPI003F8CD7DE